MYGLLSGFSQCGLLGGIYGRVGAGAEWVIGGRRGMGEGELRWTCHGEC